MPPLPLELAEAADEDEGVLEEEMKSLQMYIEKPWMCPKCGRVYGPKVQECGYCNENVRIKEQRWTTKLKLTRIER